MKEKRQEYNHDNMQGVDCDPETTLKEYGLAWIEEEGEKTLFYYGIGFDGHYYDLFDFCTLDPEMDVREEYNWIEEEDWESIYSFVDMTKEDWNALPFTTKISDIVAAYGYENIFGSTYWEGLTYEEIFQK
jgi:hypothetical protein